MANYLKPQSPLQHKDGDYFYPLTTIDQIITKDNTRLNAELINVDFSNAIENGNEAIITNADKLDGKTLDEIKDELRQEIYNEMINYSVVGGLTEPSNPTNNMIWVQTDQPITNHIFRNTEPDNPIEGMVCIFTGDYSIIEFSRILVNNIEVDEVHPLFARQYINNEWIEKKAVSYQNYKWNEWWNGELYIPGNQYEHITGGWIYKTQAGLTCQIKDDGITFVRTATYDEHGSVYTSKKIDLTNIDQIIINIKNVSAIYASNSFSIFAHATEPAAQFGGTFVFDAYTRFSNSGEILLDVSSLKGKYFVGVNSYAMLGTITSVRLA